MAAFQSQLNSLVNRYRTFVDQHPEYQVYVYNQITKNMTNLYGDSSVENLVPLNLEQRSKIVGREAAYNNLLNIIQEVEERASFDSDLISKEQLDSLINRFRRFLNLYGHRPQSSNGTIENYVMNQITKNMSSVRGAPTPEGLIPQYLHQQDKAEVVEVYETLLNFIQQMEDAMKDNRRRL